MQSAIRCPYFQKAFGWCVPIGGLAGLVGLGGGEFRLPVLMYVVDYPARTAVLAWVRAAHDLGGFVRSSLTFITSRSTTHINSATLLVVSCCLFRSPRRVGDHP
jgi:uncharacterized membrane protein YfcA